MFERIFVRSMKRMAGPVLIALLPGFTCAAADLATVLSRPVIPMLDFALWESPTLLAPEEQSSVEIRREVGAAPESPALLVVCLIPSQDPLFNDFCAQYAHGLFREVRILRLGRGDFTPDRLRSRVCEAASGVGAPTHILYSGHGVFVDSRVRLLRNGQNGDRWGMVYGGRVESETALAWMEGSELRRAADCGQQMTLIWDSCFAGSTCRFAEDGGEVCTSFCTSSMAPASLNGLSASLREARRECWLIDANFDGMVSFGEFYRWRQLRRSEGLWIFRGIDVSEYPTPEEVVASRRRQFDSPYVIDKWQIGGEESREFFRCPSPAEATPAIHLDEGDEAL